METPTKKFKVTENEISDLMVAALEGGINYWCKKAKIVDPEKYDDTVYASDVIGKNGKLILFDVESSDKWELNQANFLKGLEQAIEWAKVENFEEFFDNHDAEYADVLIQFALFGEIVFG